MARTVLVADDSPTIQRRASSILAGEGWEVVTVSNGVAAIKKLPTLKPLVTLADVSMPGRDGYEVCQFIKQSPELKHVPVVLIYSDDDPYEDARGAQAGADARVRKPFDPDELIKTVNRLAKQAEAVTVLQPVAAPPPSPPEPFSEPSEPVPPEQEPATPPPAPESNVALVPEGIAFEQFGVEEPAPTVQESAPAGEPEFEVGSAPEAPPEPALTKPEHAATEPSPAPTTSAATEPEPELVETVPAPEIEHEEEHEHPHLHEPGPFFHAPEEIGEPVLSDTDEVTTPAEQALEPASQVPPGEPSAPESEQVPSLTSEAVEAIEEAPLIPPEVAVPGLPEGGTITESEPRSPQTEPEPAAPAHGIEEAQEPPPMEAPASQPHEPSPTSGSPEESAASKMVAHAVALDTEQVAVIVRRVVVKMSPQAMPASMIEEISRRITDEIIAELKS